MFFHDIRFLSELRLRVNGEWPEPLTAQRLDPFSGLFVLRAMPVGGGADSHLVLERRRYVGQGMREDLLVRNFGEEPAFCRLELSIDCDFADLFEVKEERVRPKDQRTVDVQDGGLRFRVMQREIPMAATVTFSQPPDLHAGGATYEVVVPPRGDWSACMQFKVMLNDREVPPRYACGEPIERAIPNARLAAWRWNLPQLTVEHDQFQTLIQNSTEDLAGLRIFDPEYPERPVVAAGAPWFMTLFGRDSLLASWMALMIDPELAVGTLQTLARFQGVDTNPITEEEPGRILHEIRFTESAEVSLRSGDIYYGSVDATPLFVMLLGEVARWDIRPADVEALLPAADRALDWIERFGDRDGDGFVEYQRASDRGLLNQGWKDSWDSISFADGRLARPPIALCEVQAYVYAALSARADLAETLGAMSAVRALRERAEQLKRRFNEDFWLEEQGWFAVGLDRDKVRIDSLASNIGHCLWTGIVDDDKAPLIAKQLIGEDLWSGWGIRTLSASMGRHNPVSYHNGSVWPHDNALCVAGLMRYGFVEEAHRVVEGIVTAGAHFTNRLPELFAGLPRVEIPFPVRYPASCSPQAWAAAAPLLFLRSLLQFQPDSSRNRLELTPSLPEWIGELRLAGVPVGDGTVSLEVTEDRVIASSVPEEVELVLGSRRPAGDPETGKAPVDVTLGPSPRLADQ
jgi:glycogen debranching enzyme